MLRTGKEHLESAILSFWPHPRKFLNPDDDVKMLNTLEEKLELLEKSGIQNIFLKTFDEEFRNLTGTEFCEQVLIQKLNVKHIIIGHDHTFGKNKSGNFELLKSLSDELGFKVNQLEAVQKNEEWSLLDGAVIDRKNKVIFNEEASKLLAHNKFTYAHGFSTSQIYQACDELIKLREMLRK